MRLFAPGIRKPAFLLMVFVLVFISIVLLSSALFSSSLTARPLDIPQQSINTSKVALLIDDRPRSILIPLILHMTNVLPPDWAFHFIGSQASIDKVSSSVGIQHHVQRGKLTTTLMPPNSSVAGREAVSAFMTMRWLWHDLLAQAEHVLVYQTDSILCSKSQHRIDDFLMYDWIGSPWSDRTQIGGNGGLSLRRASVIRRVLDQEEREAGDHYEDDWYTRRLVVMNGTAVANRTMGMKFSGQMQVPEEYQGSTSEGADRRTMYEPFGYHFGFSGSRHFPDLWGTPELRSHVWEYCPEVKLLFDHMDATEYVPGDCNSTWNAPFSSS